MIDRLFLVKSYVGVPSVSSTQDCPLQREPCVPGQSLRGVKCDSIGGVDVHGLCWPRLSFKEQSLVNQDIIPTLPHDPVKALGTKDTETPL